MRLWGLALFLGCSEPPTSQAPVVGEPTPPAAAPRAQAEHVVLVVIDTLRADAQRKARTPVLDALAERGVEVQTAWAGGTWTVPSVISLLTGASVRRHGWDARTGRFGRYAQLPDLPTLPKVFDAAGFETAGFYANPYLAEDLGFADGFDVWKRTPDKAMPGVVAKWAAGRSDARQFVYLHMLGPHSPLRPSTETREHHQVAPDWFDEKRGFDIGAAKRNKPFGAREAYAAGYHAVIEDTDRLLGEVLAATGLPLERSLVVVTSDHGELLGEHGIVGHGYWVWGPLTDVPLVAAGPGADALVATRPTSNTQVADLLTDAAGLDHPWPVQVGAGGPLVAQREGKVALLLDGRWRGVWDPTADGPQYFDLRTDPDELAPLARDPGLEAARAAFDARVPAGEMGPTQVALSEETTAELEALGYVDGTDAP